MVEKRATRSSITKLLDNAIEALWNKSRDTQDAIARLMIDVVDDREPEPVPAEHLAAVLDGEAQADRGEFVADEEVTEAFRSFGR